MHPPCLSDLPLPSFLPSCVDSAEYVDEARRAFLMMDTNRDEAISQPELRAGLASLGLTLSGKQLKTSFVIADADSSGEIDFDVCDGIPTGASCCSLLGVTFWCSNPVLQEFLEFVGGAETEASKAIKDSLLGVRA